MDQLANLITAPENLAIIIVVGILIVVALLAISRVFGGDSSQELKQKLKTQSSKELRVASKLLEDGHHPQAVIQAHKALERVMKGVLNNNSAKSFDAIKALQSKGKLSRLEVDKAHQLRKARNVAAHEESKLKPQTARIMVSNARSIINSLLK